MKLRKRFWGIVGSLAFAAGRVQAGDVPASPSQQAAVEIASAIAREVSESGYTVNVDVRNGVATLRGNVSSPAQLHRVLEAAKSGRCRIKNELKVGTASVQTVAYQEQPGPAPEMPVPAPAGQALTPAAPEFTFPQGAAPQYDAPFLPPFAWPARAPYPNYSAVQYPRDYASYEWPYIGPFHPYPEPPLDWRKVKMCNYTGLRPWRMSQDPPPEWQCIDLRWEDGHWYMNFKQAWWAKRGLGCGKRCDDEYIGCGTMGGGYHLSFPHPWCTHMFVN